MHHRFPRFFTLLLLAIPVLCATSVLSGCAIVGIGIQSVKDAGITESDRQELLAKAIKEFHQVLFFGRVDVAMEQVDSDLARTLGPRLVKQFKSEKMVEHSIDDTKFSEHAFEADVVVTVKMFRNTDFLLKEREIHERWKFTLGGDWTLVSYEVTEPGHG